MFNNNAYNNKNLIDSILLKKIYLKYHPKDEASKNKENHFIQSLIQSYKTKYLGARIKLNRTWLCIKISYNESKEDKLNPDEETNDSVDNLLNLFIVPKDVSSQILNYLKTYDKFVEIADDSKEEYLIDLTSYIINNKEQFSNNDINLFLHEIKLQMEQKFNIKVFIGKANNILLASLACLKCFIESIKNKNNESIIISDINDLFEDNSSSDYLISIENDEKNILSFLDKFPFEYLSNSDNKYIENFKKLINIKNFNNIKTLGNVINGYSQDIYNIFNKNNIYKDIFLFCLGIGDIFHKNQIISYHDTNINKIDKKEEENFKNKNKSQLIKIYTQLANKLFKQIFFYQYNAKTLVVILKTKKNKIYKRVVDKETLFDDYDIIINTGTHLIEQICDNLSENEINNFNKMIIYFDNIIKLDTIKRNIWEEIYENEINEIRIKSNKLCFWNNFLNSKSKNEEKIMSKSVDNLDNNNSSVKQSEKKRKSVLNSKSINDINKFSKKANLDLLGFNKKKKQNKGSKYLRFSLLSHNNKLENYGITSKEQKK